MTNSANQSWRGKRASDMTDDEIRAMVEVPVDSLEPSPAELGDTITVTPNEWTPIGDNGTEIYVYGDQPITLVVRA